MTPLLTADERQLIIKLIDLNSSGQPIPAVLQAQVRQLVMREALALLDERASQFPLTTQVRLATKPWRASVWHLQGEDILSFQITWPEDDPDLVVDLGEERVDAD